MKKILIIRIIYNLILCVHIFLFRIVKLKLFSNCSFLKLIFYGLTYLYMFLKSNIFAIIFYGIYIFKYFKNNFEF